MEVKLLNDIRECINILSNVVKLNEGSLPKSIKADPFDLLLAQVEASLAFDSPVRQWLTIQLPQQDEVSSFPSTSTGPLSHKSDPRVRYADTLKSIFRKLTELLNIVKVQPDVDKYTLLSIQDIAIISAAAEFFVLTSILPYLDEGIGLPVKVRSSVIKHWRKCSGDIQLQRDQLNSACDTLNLLIGSHENIRYEIVNRFLLDLICCHEQLGQLGFQREDYETLLESVSRDELFRHFLTLLRGFAGRPAPSWATISIGRRLSSILREPGGLIHLISTYNDADDNLWTNTHKMTSLAMLCASCTQKEKPMTYYLNITDQFYRLIESGRFDSKGTGRLFSLFADVLAKRMPLAAEVFVLDVLFKPWESLTASSGSLTRHWSSAEWRSLRMLKLWMDPLMRPSVVTACSRALSVLPVLMGILAEENTTNNTVSEVLEALLAIVSSAVATVENRSELLMQFVLDENAPCFSLQSTNRPLVAVIDDNKGTPLTDPIIIEQLVVDREESLMLRLNTVLRIIRSLDVSMATYTVIEMVCICVSHWSKAAVSTAEVPRFVQLQGNVENNPEWMRMCSHLAALALFDFMTDSPALESTEPSMVLGMLRLVNTVLLSICESHREELNTVVPLIRGEKEMEESSKMEEIQVQSAKMAVGLSAAVIGVAMLTEETAIGLSETTLALKRFCEMMKNFESYVDSVTEAMNVLELMSQIGLDSKESSTNEVPAAIGLRKSKSKDPVNVLDALRSDLWDETEASRGQALLQTAKLIRSKTALVVGALDEWIYPRVIELVRDRDSYVYLAAINALAECACYDGKYLREMLSMFRYLGKNMNTVTSDHEDKETKENEPVDDSDAVIILRGKIAETIGKVFRVLGDLAPSWLSGTANIMLPCLQEDEEIIRASALSTFSDLILACRGRGIDSLLTEILYATSQIIQTDKSTLVRRAATHLVRQLLRSCDKDIIQILSGNLRDLRRQISYLHKFDRDHVVRLHAELCLEELKYCMDEALSAEVNQRMRLLEACIEGKALQSGAFDPSDRGKYEELTMGTMVDTSTVLLCINEFYTTNDAQRRSELNNWLCEFKTAYPVEETIASCLLLTTAGNPPNVQCFAAACLYDVIRKRSEELIANINLVESVKGFLIENLTTQAHIQMQSLTNKLSSTLAILSLYCVIDVWPQPVADLTTLWAGNPDLLLRVLTEVAAEFRQVQMPLTMRSRLKTELHRISEDIVRIISTVMGAQDATPSTRQAAVECVEQWVQLPGAGLGPWTEVLSAVFLAVAEDNSALTSLLQLLASNEEVESEEQLVLDVCTYVAFTMTQKLASELSEDASSDEVGRLVSAVCSMSQRAVPILIKHHLRERSELLPQLCMLLATISGFQGVYPEEEAVSELPASFFTTLRENLLGGGRDEGKHATTIQAVNPYYAQLLHSAIDKLAYPPWNEFHEISRDSREQFAIYRINRSELPVDVYQICGDASLDFLNQRLQENIEKKDICRAECCLYLWEMVADYLTEREYPQICALLQMVGNVSRWSDDVGARRDLDRLGATLMRLLDCLSHLVQAHDKAEELETHVLGMCAALMDRPSVTEIALRCVENYVKERSASLEIALQKVGEALISRCHTFFMDERHGNAARLTALKCIGFVLSMRSSQQVMELLDQLVAPHLGGLADGGEIKTEQELAKRQFQISIFTSLFVTLGNKRKTSENDPMLMLLRQAIPLFQTLVQGQGPHTVIGDTVCDAVRSAAGLLSTNSLPEMLELVVDIVDRCLVTNPKSACNLAKTVVYIFGGEEATSPQVSEAISRWFSEFEKHTEMADVDDWMLLVLQVIKKEYKVMRSHGPIALQIIQSSVNLSSKYLVESGDPSVVRLSAQILASLSSQTISYDDQRPKQILANNGEHLIRSTFRRVQIELIRPTVEALSEVLFFYAKHFTTETRNVLNGETNGDCPLVAAMFREIGNLRNFKQMTLRLNQTCRKAAL